MWITIKFRGVQKMYLYIMCVGVSLPLIMNYKTNKKTGPQ